MAFSQTVPRAARLVPPAPSRALLPLFLESDIAIRASQPVTVGLPFPRGMLPAPGRLGLRDAAGASVPLQTECLARWADGSVKWLLLDFVVAEIESGRCLWMVERAADETPPPGPRLRLTQTADNLLVDTGATTFCIGRRIVQPLARVIQNGNDVLEEDGLATTLLDARGRVRTPRLEAMAVESHGPVRATVRIDGVFPGMRGLRCRLRLSVFAGTDLVRLALTIHNPNRARHRGGLWDLGDPGALLFRELSLALSLRASGEADLTWTAEPHETPRCGPAARLEIYQDSSGGDNWQSPNHVNRHGRVPCSFRGYRCQAPREERVGLRANPILRLATQHAGMSVAVPEFWQQFPKALEVSGQAVRVGLFPRQWSELFELQGGEQKTHTIWLDFAAQAGADSLRWAHAPVRAHAASEWYAGSGAIPYLSPGPCDVKTPFASVMSAAIRDTNGLLARREIIDEYGWRNYGELYADHEGAYYAGPAPVISHYNNQYDVVYAAILQYLRTGDVRWVDLFDPLARHVIDIDIYHTSRDRAAYNGGLFWHTDHYRDAATATHRAFSRTNQRPGQPYGGGPCDEHNYATGLLHYYFLTGDANARDAVKSLADWTIAMDDGGQNVLGVVDDGPTGAASATAEPEYHGPGRGCGNSINTLLDGWLVSGSRKYLAKAEELVRRAIHPADDIAARNLLDVERRWSYTVFLSVLSRYLQLKREAGELDFMYAYARAALLHYAQWMLTHERPYFDHPEKLEFPTETWAAQDLRKANILRLAAAHADGLSRFQLLRRGAELANRAWSHLMRFTSHNVTRSLALIMIEGTRDAYFRKCGVSSVPPPSRTLDFGQPLAFSSQRARVMRQLKSPRGLGRALLRLLNPRHWRKLLLPR